MNILLLASHEIAEYDDLRMFTEMGHDVFCPGGYQNPRQHEGLRPAIPEAPVHFDLIDACERVRREYGDPGPLIDAAKGQLPDEVIDWAEVIIVHHFPERWIGGQWPRIAHKRVIWRTCGQSNPELEEYMSQGRAMGMQIVRYSPKERNLPNYAGEDAVIRFGKDPADYRPWVGDEALVGNVTQHMAQRGDATGYGFWKAATEGLPVKPAGPGSEEIAGLGPLSYDEMREYLRHIRCYLYTGTKPASYTLGLIEAMMTGTPVVSIGPRSFGSGWVGDVFEGHEIASGSPYGLADASVANNILRDYLAVHAIAEQDSPHVRQRAIDLFGIDKIKAEWAAFLDA